MWARLSQLTIYTEWARNSSRTPWDGRLTLTLDTGGKGLARVSEMQFNSRAPRATLVRFTRTGPLA